MFSKVQQFPLRIQNMMTDEVKINEGLKQGDWLVPAIFDLALKYNTLYRKSN